MKAGGDPSHPYAESSGQLISAHHSCCDIQFFLQVHQAKDVASGARV
jgi:hypothetical protein